ncbi:hypothetical protein FB45DRAFT_1056599 [Roridomyces roridus]|uniref:Uncharacterized protein n=1 Tax=Roridomyces roridus TaxID=1738132 RepID=A0AAD7BYT9_9AGAR|nr:hypothetical protein FB45DRAFT_1056599 [Roridomyces roridus]
MLVSSPSLAMDVCRKATVTYGYTTCAPCREKRAKYKRDRTERLRAEKAKEKAKILKASVASNVTPKSVVVGEKRKTPSDGRDAVESMRKRFKAMETPRVKTEAKPVVVDPAAPVFAKFVASNELHKEIKRQYSRMGVASLRFYGTYAIIALPDVDNKQRARAVARDLKESTNLHFNLDDKTVGKGSNGTVVYRYSCTCHATSTLKRQASDLAVYFKKKKQSAADAETAMPEKTSECGGKIKISVEHDNSHPQGWLGQRVKVTVKHPKTKKL